MTRFNAVAAVLALALLPSPWAAGQEKKEPELTALEKQVLKLTNDERAKEKLPPLKLNAVLCKVAHAHTANMVKQGKLEHTLDGKTPGQRIGEAGYVFRAWGENIFGGPARAEDALKFWMNSEGHRANILNKQFAEIGVSAVQVKGGLWYFTQVFATPRK